MKKAIGCSAQIVLLLVLACLLALPMACVATVTAPLHTPQIAETFLCPPNTHMQSEWYRATWNEPGEKTLSVRCVDTEGKETSTLPQDGKVLLAGTWIYFPYLFVPLLVIGIIVLAGLNALGIAVSGFWKKMRNKQA